MSVLNTFVNKIRLFTIILYRIIIQNQFYNLFRNFVFRHRYDDLQNNYKLLLEKLKKKVINGEKVKVAFYIWEISKWKNETIYRLLENDKRFDPYIVVVPFASGAITGLDYLKNMHRVADFFIQTNHKVFFPYNEEKGLMLSQRDAEELNPDILFQMNCWHEYGRFKQFGYRQNTHVLQAYVPYAWMISNRYWEHFNRDFHNVMWRIYYETPIHVEMAKKYSITKGCNAIALGYPFLDRFFDKDYLPSDVWKLKERKIKRIIWAPHCFINEENRCSNFLFIYDKMIELAVKYKDYIQIAFKPHPELEKKLDYGIPGWNKKRREDYYRKWKEMPNTMLCTGDYIDLFLTSDAMIHDCGSFTAEYTCTYKPVLFLESNPGVVDGWNECGKAIVNHLYRSKKGEKIEEFISQIVINGDDYMLKERTSFINDYLKPKNKRGASVGIYEDLKMQLGIFDELHK